MAAAAASETSSSMSFSEKRRTWIREFSTISPGQPSESSSGAATRLRTPELMMLSGRVEPLVGARVHDQRRQALLGHLADQAARVEEVAAEPGQPSLSDPGELAVGLAQEDDGLLRPQVGEGAVEHQLEQGRERDRRGQRPVELVQQAQAVRVVAQPGLVDVLAQVPAPRPAASSAAAGRNSVCPGSVGSRGRRARPAPGTST